MIFINGFVHCDPHPGNLLINPLPNKKDFEIVLLDHGLYQSLSRTFRYNYANLWMSLLGKKYFLLTNWTFNNHGRGVVLSSGEHSAKSMDLNLIHSENNIFLSEAQDD